MKKMMMILVAVAAIGFTACDKTKTVEQKDQVELTTDEQKVDENAAEATAEEGAKADEAPATEENTEAAAEENKEEKK